MAGLIGRVGTFAHGRRRAIRVVAAALCAACTVVYLLIGAGIVYPVAGLSAEEHSGIVMFGLMAGGAFALGTLLLLAFDRPLLWLLGAAFQVGAIAMYLAVAEKRDPPFEFWGVALKVVQVAILAALLALLADRRRPAPLHDGLAR